MLQNTSRFFAGATILLLAYLLFLIFQPFATPLILSAVMVVLLYPLYEKLAQRMKPSWAAIISTLLIFIIVIIPVSAIITSIVYETLDLAKTMGTIPIDKIMAKAETFTMRFGIDLNAMMTDASQRIASQSGLVATYLLSNIWHIVIGIFVTLLATFFIFRDGEKALKILQ